MTLQDMWSIPLIRQPCKALSFFTFIIKAPRGGVKGEISQNRIEIFCYGCFCSFW